MYAVIKFSLLFTVGISLLIISFTTYPVFIQSVYAESWNNPTFVVPQWVKTNAGWWAEDKISDFDFILGLNHLIEEKVIIVPSTDRMNTNPQNIPSWIKNTAGWWAEDSIEDESFVKSIQFLIKEGIINPKIN